MYYNDFEPPNKDRWEPDTPSLWLYAGFAVISLIWLVGVGFTAYYICDFFKWVISNG
jgi:hypothetical protein